MSNRLLLFLGLSVAAHGVVLGIYNANDETPVLQLPHNKLGGITISVNISKPQVNKDINRNKNTINKQRKSILITKPLKLTTVKIQKSVSNTLNNTVKEQTVSQNYSRPKEIEKADGETLSKIIYTEFSKYFFYPKAAQRRNLQGKVILKFTIQANGVINQIQVSESSGYHLLDNAALEALKKIDNTNNFVTALNGNSVKQTLPVVYQLVQ